MNENIRPYDSLSGIKEVLAVVGFYSFEEPKTRLRWILFQIYRCFVVIMMCNYGIECALYYIPARGNLAKMGECLVLTSAVVNSIIKLGTVLYQTKRIDKINESLKHGVLCELDEQDKKIVQKNTKFMALLFKIVLVQIVTTCVVWFYTNMSIRYNDVLSHGRDEPSPFFPYTSDTWPKFWIACIYSLGTMLYIGVGHITLDTSIVSYFLQIRTQLRIIRHQLENLVPNDKEIQYYASRDFQFKDLIDDKVQKRFVSIVKRYEKVNWLMQEVNTSFDFALSGQFLTNTINLTFVIYTMSLIPVMSFEIVYMFTLLCTVLMQMYIVSYFGNLVVEESSLVTTSLYNTDWVSLSPPFRRQMLIVMCRWSQPLQPMLFGIVPINVETFVKALKTSYSFYTVLIAR